MDGAPVFEERSKRGPRCYYAVIAFLLAILFMDSVVGLGCFGVLQHDVAKKLGSNRCILFCSYGSENGEDKVIMSNIGSCAFMLWALVTLVLVSLVLMIYNIVLFIVGPRMISMLRILDFVVYFILFWFAMAVSITMTAGFNKTCGAFHSNSHCPSNYIVKHDDKSVTVHFYTNLSSAQNSLWIATVFILLLAVWNGILLILVCRQAGHRRRVLSVGQYASSGDYGSGQKRSPLMTPEEKEEEEESASESDDDDSGEGNEEDSITRGDTEAIKKNWRKKQPKSKFNPFKNS